MMYLAVWLKIIFFFNSELASVKAHDREVTQQAKYAQDEVLNYFSVFPLSKAAT